MTTAPPTRIVVGVGVDGSPASAEALRWAAEEAELHGATGIAEVRPVVRRGSPAGVILDAASNAELIVVGTRGRGAIKRVLLGSVATHVTHHAAAPVVVIPPTAMSPEAAEATTACRRSSGEGIPAGRC